MEKYQLRFYFEHGGICIWGMNDSAKEKYGYAIETSVLPISDSLKVELNLLEEDYATYLDWDDPAGPSLWSEEKKNSFLNVANRAYEKLKNELGLEFEVLNEAYNSVEI